MNAVYSTDYLTPAFCPECGSPLTVCIEENNKTGDIEIAIFCEGPGEDEYDLVINTHLKNDELRDWDQENPSKKSNCDLIL